MLLVRKHHQADIEAESVDDDAPMTHDAPTPLQADPPAAQRMLTLEQIVRELHGAGHSQRAIARNLRMDRRNVKQIVDHDV